MSTRIRVRIFSGMRALTLALLGIAIVTANAENLRGITDVQIDNNRGVDSRVDYASLTRYGLWDDRNYQLRAEDLDVLAKNEHELTTPIPAFFRVEMRKEFPNIRREGKPQYPRSAVPMFLLRYGGVMQNGIIEGDKRKNVSHGKDGNTRDHATVISEGPVSAPGTDGNESTVEINPVNPSQVIGGANVSAGQEMYYSSNGGDTWFSAGVLPDTCCDPTVEWSLDGTVAHAAALGSNTSIDTWRSLDGGQTWIDHIEHEGGGRDKEWLHVDRSPTSPHAGNLYLSWHDGNVQKFRRNTDPQGSIGGWQPILAFPGEPRGIGSDITSDPAGNVYYFYGDTDNSAIHMLKSTDGGATFSGSQVATTVGNFDFPIPSMTLRNAWIYAATASDHSGGVYNGSLYVSWTDLFLPAEADPANNHTQIHVAYSRDGGATWTQTFPHATSDVLTVDRWNQWLDVDENGVVHSVYYDTRNSASREGVDMYYSYSTDGAQTWHAPTRISGSTSTTPTFIDLQQFGDYNGVSAKGSRVIPTWTDNRDAIPGDNKHAYMAAVQNPAGAPGFGLGVTPLKQAVCAPGNLATMTVNISSVAGFSDPVALSYAGVPAGFSGSFAPASVTAPGSANADMTVGAVSAGDYSFDIVGTATGLDPKSVTANVGVSTAAPGSAATLTSPADGSPDQGATPTLEWTAVADASSYLVEVDDDPSFLTPVYTATSNTNNHQVATPLTPDVTYYWRITATNPCGDGIASSTFSFTVPSSLCSTSAANIPDGAPAGHDDLIVVGNIGTILDLIVSVNVSHSYVGDIEMTLTHVNTGTSLTLLNQSNLGLGVCAGNDINAEFDDSALTPASAECAQSTPAINGSFQPDLGTTLLDVFDGEAIAGTWKLTVIDHVNADAGVLNEWCLLPDVQIPDTDADGFDDLADNCPAVANAGQEDGDTDGVGDACDNCTLVANADQCDSNLDGYGNMCDPDLNNNGVINFIDMGMLKNAFSSADADADLNCNGVVNFVDLGILKSMFLGPPGPSALAP